MRQLRNAKGISASRFVEQYSGFEFDSDTTEELVRDYFTVENFELMFPGQNDDIDDAFLENCADLVIEEIEKMKEHEEDEEGKENVY